MGVAGRIGLAVAKRWIAGVNLDDAISEARRINLSGEDVMINYLGEDISEKPKVTKTVKKYVKLIKLMKSGNISGCIALKPTQIGLSIGFGLFLQNYVSIVKHARHAGIFVWLDMEDYQYVDDTIKAYLITLKRNKNVGICIQSKLRRSMHDIKAIVKKGGAIRLVKGAYEDRGQKTYNSRGDVDRNYLECMRFLFLHAGSFMIATHDDKILEVAARYLKRRNKNVMFGMLKGIRPSLAMRMVKEGKSLYIYLPFGENWLEYSMRRLKEKRNTSLILRSVFQG